MKWYVKNGNSYLEIDNATETWWLSPSQSHATAFSSKKLGRAWVSVLRESFGIVAKLVVVKERVK